jgi:alpha-L-fucosidase
VGHVHDGQVVWGGKGAAHWGSAELLATIRNCNRNCWSTTGSTNGSWGYDRENRDFKSVGLLVRMPIDTVAKDGNLLLNVGPDARGSIDPSSADILRGIGNWMRLHKRSIHGCGPSLFTAPPDCRYTQRGNRHYLHLFAWPFDAAHLPGLADRLVHAQFLHDGSEIAHEIADPSRPAYATSSAGQRSSIQPRLSRRSTRQPPGSAARQPRPVRRSPTGPGPWRRR